MRRGAGNHIDLGREVQRVRTQQGLTQADLATAAGVSRRWLGQLEAGHAGAQVDKVFAVLRTLQVRLRFVEDVAPADSSGLAALLDNKEW